MKTRKILGWLIVGIGIFSLFITILHDYHIDLGPFSVLYSLLDWFSLEMVLESFGLILQFIFRYFWMLLLIVLGFALIFGTQQQDDLYAYYQTREKHQQGNSILYKNLDNKKIAGVCSGIAYKFEIDPTVIRIVFVFVGFYSAGLVLFIYLMLALILPGTHLG